MSALSFVPRKLGKSARASASSVAAVRLPPQLAAIDAPELPSSAKGKARSDDSQKALSDDDCAALALLALSDHAAWSDRMHVDYTSDDGCE